MALSVEEIKQILKEPKAKNEVAKAVRMERRLRFHTETALTAYDNNTPVQEFLEWVNSLIPKDKFNTFTKLFTFPLPTPAIVEDVYRELERVFYSRNANATYQFADSGLSTDWKKYQRDKLNEPVVWRTEGWERMKTATHSIMIVDLPSVQESELPEPYFYFLDISSVVDLSSPDGNSIEWIAFRQGEDKIAVFDDTYMRVLSVKGTEVLSVISEVEHGLSYCPARFFWSTRLNKGAKIMKKNPVTKELANLDWLLFFAISKRHLDLYAPYPIYSAYEADCNFANNETGDYCDGGFLRNSGGEYKLLHAGGVEPCPVCSQKHIVGPGSFLEVPAPTHDAPDMKNPVSITTIDEASLNYNVKECERLEKVIYDSCIGIGGDVSEKEAINETQVSANFEGKTSVLVSLKSNFEQAQRFIDETVCRLRYGNSFLGCSINWGTEFYVFTVKDLYDRYKQAKDNGASDSELDALMHQILETEYRTNPTQLQRMQIIRQIEPYRHYTRQETLDMYKEGIVTVQELRLKANMSYYIDRFERENINIVEFGSNLPFREKIDRLTKTLLSYVGTETIKPRGTNEPEG